MGLNINFGLDSLLPSSTSTSQTGNVSGTQKQQRVLSQEGTYKIIADVLGGDVGLSALAQGENVSGLSGTSIKTMLAQDLVAKLVGEIANITAPIITTTDQTTTTQAKSKKGLSVICTELREQGKLSEELYEAGTAHFLRMSPSTVRGYRVWADKVVPLMKKSERLSNSLLPIAVARYEHITGRRKNLLGAATVYIGQPICWVIGQFVFKPLAHLEGG